MLQFIIVSVYYIVVYRITQLFPSYCLSIRCHCQSGKRAEGIVVSALIYTLYARIIIRLLLNMDIKDISNCFFRSYLFDACEKKTKQLMRTFHFNCTRHIHTHTHTQILSERCYGVPGVIGGQVLCSVGACTFFLFFFFSLCLHTCLRIIYCHWRWVYEPGLKSGQQKRRANIIFLTFDIIRYNDIRNRVSELAEARLSWRALTPALLSSVRFGWVWLWGYGSALGLSLL